NYAQTRDELQAMCNGIARSLKPGGRFVSVNSNPGLDFPTAPSYRKYGFETKTASVWKEGTPIRWIIHLEDGSFEIETYYLDVAIHEQAFRAAGFREARWHNPRLAPQGQVAGDPDFWTSFMTHPPVIFIECVK